MQIPYTNSTEKSACTLRVRLGDIAGTWQEDEELDRAIADQDRVDEATWR